MDIPLNVVVECTDGEAGRSLCVIVDPIKDLITHLVVREKGPADVEHVVPVGKIVETTPKRIRLSCAVADLKRMPHFYETQFIPYQGGGRFGWPYYPLGVGGYHVGRTNIPLHELVICRGDRVTATDGAVGRVDEFLVDPATDGITHLVMREGHLWGQRDVTIPVAQIERIESAEVFLKLSKAEVAALPVVPVKR